MPSQTWVSESTSRNDHLPPLLVMLLCRVRSTTEAEFVMQSLSTLHPGSEPGINPRRAFAAQSYGNFKQACVIDVSDYDADNASVRGMGNAEFIDWVGKSTNPSGVRWVNIGGLDWDVINLHPLALEDVLHEQGHNQSKADYYHEHLFIRILCHSGERDTDTEEFPHSGAENTIERVEEGNGRRGEVRNHQPLSPVELYQHGARRSTSTGLSGFIGSVRKRQIQRIRALKKGNHIDVVHEAMSIFLLRNGTVITIHRKPELEFTAPIRERLLHPESVLRTSVDASLLVEGLLDLVVDRVLQVVDEYQDKIHEVEHDALLNPGLGTLRTLHILSSDLIMHKRTLEPVKALINDLRNKDIERCVALANHTGCTSAACFAPSSSVSSSPDAQHVQGYLSCKAKFYLSDVSDHMDFVLTSLDMWAGLSENLINFAFNTASYKMNQIMRRLTLANIIFLPLTLLVGYFGMNFTSFDAIDGSVSMFWTIALPVMAVLIPLFMLSDIQSILHNLQKSMAADKVADVKKLQRG